MRIGTLTVKQRAAELDLQRLDGARERGLRNAALFGGAREVQLLAERKK
jgi:hypothetical protein